MKHLKKLSFGVFAMIFGLAIVLTQSAFKSTNHRASYTFYYDGPDYSENEVKDPSNWKLGTQSCGTPTDNVPCTILVDDDYVDNPTSPTALDPDIDLQATQHDTNEYYISGSDDASMEITNRAN